MEDNEQLYEQIGNYTKYKLVGMLIDKHKDCKLDNLNEIEEIADDILKVLTICGLKYYDKLKGSLINV